MGGNCARHYAIAWRLALGCWAGCALLQILLYLRPSPYGGAFLLEWRKYFALALYYDLLGVWILATPFLLFWLLCWRRPDKAPSRAVAVHGFQAAAMAANLAASAFDHELLRFLGIRLGFSFLFTYLRPETLSDSLFIDVLADDRGGPFLPILFLLLAPILYLWWAKRLIRRRLDREAWLPGGFWTALLILILPIAAPANAWRMATGKFRLRKVEPVVLALAVDVALGFGDLRRPEAYPRLVRDNEGAWLAASGDKEWTFPDPKRPYLRVPSVPAAPDSEDGRKWNIIYLQLETFRGVDMGFLAPRAGRSPTPYLDALAARGDSAVWTRALSLGPPSINGLFGVHCSVTPHSSRYISAFTNDDLDCLPDILRRHGWRTEMFNAGDTDWDNSTFWLTRWYDRLWRYPSAREQDRPVFRAAAARIRELGASGRPFLASIVSVTNHTPFRSREAGFDIAGGVSPSERILNTTRYTDDVVREFLEGLRREPWFANTLVVIAGDHGFNLGEHDGRPGQKNLYRESVWVPLIIAGPHKRLPRGRTPQLASLLDLAPTLADLLGIREANAWQGRSLVAPGGRPSYALKANDMLMLETDSWSALSDPRHGRPRLFDSRRDWLQHHDLSTAHPSLAEAMLAHAAGRIELNNYLLRRNLVWRDPIAASAGRKASRAAPTAAPGRTAPPPIAGPRAP